jgi:MipA family protein
MKSEISKLLMLVSFAMPGFVSAQQNQTAVPGSEVAAPAASEADAESAAAALDAPEAEQQAESDDADKKSDEHLKLIDRTGELSRQNIIDALPKGFILGAAAINVPNRYSESDQNFYAVPGFVYLGDRFFYLGDRASYNLVRGEHLSFNVNARYRFTSLDPEEVPEFNTLNPRDGQLEAGFGLNALTPVGFFTTRINADVSGKSNGYLADATWFLPYYKKGLLIMPAIGFTWYDSNFSNYYYGGVSPEEANPLLPAFDTGSTTSLNGILVVGYRFNPHWFLTGGAIYSRLSSNVADSPVLLGRDTTILFSAFGYIWE